MVVWLERISRLKVWLAVFGLLLTGVGPASAAAPLPDGWRWQPGTPMILGDFNGDGADDWARLLQHPAGGEWALFLTLATPDGWRQQLALILPPGTDPHTIILHYIRPVTGRAVGLGVDLPDGQHLRVDWRDGSAHVSPIPAGG